MPRPSIVVSTKDIIETQRPSSSPKLIRILGEDAFESKSTSPSGDKIALQEVTPAEAEALDRAVQQRISERVFKSE